MEEKSAKWFYQSFKGQKKNDIVLIDKNQDLIDRLLNKLILWGFAKLCRTWHILVEAGVENCDIFISVTEMDEITIIASILAEENWGWLLRVRNPEYSQQLQPRTFVKVQGFLGQLTQSFYGSWYRQ